MLDCLERLDRKKEHQKALRMARALATLLMLLKRWAGLLQTLRIGLRAAESLGDLEAVAWAKHEIGTLRLAAGDVEGAERDLHKAKEIREQVGDRRGLATTNRNLGVLCEQLRQMLRDEQLVRRPTPRSLTPRWAVFAVIFALFFAGAGFAVGSLTDSDETAPAEASDNGNGGGGDGGGTPSGNNGGDDVDERDFTLAVTIAGEGNGIVKGPGLSCEEGTCETVVSAGETVVLTATANEDSEFDGFSEPCGSDESCTLRVTEPVSMTASFSFPSDSDDEPEEVEPGTAPTDEVPPVEEESEGEEAFRAPG